jgi:uncharacterized protein
MATGREVLEHAFRETAKGNGRPFVDMLADDVEWSIIGSTEWSETFRGKSSVIGEATRFIAEGNLVAVEGRNLSVTRRGPAYPNRYCWIFEMRDGMAVRITEYCDTALVERTLVRAGK